MGVDHGRPHIRMPEQCLDRPDIIIGLQKMGCKTVAEEGMRSDALGELGIPDRFIKGLLDMSLVEMIPSELFCARNRCKRLLREEPLPDKILCCRRILLFKQVVKKHSCISCCEIFVMNVLNKLKLVSQFRHNRLRKRNRAVLLPFSMDSEYPGIEVKILHTQLQTFKQPESAAVKQFDYEIIRMLKVLQHGLYFLSGKNYRNIFRLFSTGNVPVISEILLEGMPEQKKKRIERLILS